MKDNNWKFPPTDFSRKYLQVCLPMLPIFSDKFKIHNTHQREIENILLKINNKRNSTIGDSVKKSYGYCNQVLDRCNTNYLCHDRSLIMMLNNRFSIFLLFLGFFDNIRMVFQ